MAIFSALTLLASLGACVRVWLWAAPPQSYNEALSAAVARAEAAEKRAERAEAVLAATSTQRAPVDTSRRLEDGFEGCGSRCDLRQRRFVIILSAGGRTGSTSALDMINMLPGVHLGGEHQGELELFKELLNRMRTIRKHGGGAAWNQHNEFYDKTDEVYCLAQRWIFLHTGSNCDSGTVHGFKEIRYFSAPMLDFLYRAFPNAKWIINYRLDQESQSGSAFFSRSDHSKAMTHIAGATRSLLEFAKNHSNSTFLLPVEHFNTDTFTRLFAFIGFPQCRAVGVSHMNDNNTYSRSKRSLISRFVQCV